MKQPSEAQENSYHRGGIGGTVYRVDNLAQLLISTRGPVFNKFAFTTIKILTIYLVSQNVKNTKTDKNYCVLVTRKFQSQDIKSNYFLIRQRKSRICSLPSRKTF